MTPLLPIALACGGDDGAPGHISYIGDSADTGPAPTAIEGSLDIPEDTALGAPFVVGAVLVRFGAGPEMGGTLASSSAATSFNLTLPDAAPEADRSSLEPEGPTGAAYALVAFEDADGDGAFVEGETIRGLAMERFLLWIDDGGGWRLADLGLAGQYEHHRCLLDTTRPLSWREGYPVYEEVEVPVTVALPGLDADLVMGGEVLSLPEGVTGLAAVPYQALTGEWVLPLHDGPVAAGPFAFGLDDEPPAELDVGGDPDWRFAIALPLLYADMDGDGTLGEDDEIEGTTACYEDRWAWARYTRSVSTWRGYRLLDCYGANVGWRAVTMDPADGWTTWLGSDEAASLVVDPETCRADG